MTCHQFKDVSQTQGYLFIYLFGASPVVLVVKKPPANAGDKRDAGLIPGLGRSLEKEMATHSSVLTWRIPRTEEPGGVQSKGSQRVIHD